MEQNSVAASTEELKLISGKWKLEILYILSDGPIRWNGLAAKLPAISPKELTRQLSSLLRDGLLYRNILSSRPPQVIEYGLTAHGQRFVPLVQRLAAWSSAYNCNAGDAS